MASASFLEITPDAQSAGMACTGLAITDNGSTAIFHNASTIAFSQDVMGASYSYADINKDFGMPSICEIVGASCVEAKSYNSPCE